MDGPPNVTRATKGGTWLFSWAHDATNGDECDFHVHEDCVELVEPELSDHLHIGAGSPICRSAEWLGTDRLQLSLLLSLARMALQFDLGTPLNTALLLYILYSVHRVLLPPTPSLSPSSVPTEFKGGYSWMPKAHPPTVLFKTYTPKTLQPFSGEDGGRILLAINSIVFDVTAGRNFYGPNGMYGNFAGRDASRGMAKQSFDTEMLTPIDQSLDKLEDLRQDEIDNMKGWIDHFSNKYIICGKLVENDVL